MLVVRGLLSGYFEGGLDGLMFRLGLLEWELDSPDADP